LLENHTKVSVPECESQRAFLQAFPDATATQLRNYLGECCHGPGSGQEDLWQLSCFSGPDDISDIFELTRVSRRNKIIAVCEYLKTYITGIKRCQLISNSIILASGDYG